MLVNLRIGAWAGRRLDRSISEEITEQKNATGDALRVNKHLVPKETLAAVVSASNALRGHFYEATLPWADQGARVITRVGYRPFLEKHEKLMRNFQDAATHLVEVDYPAARAQAEFRMGDAFNEEDYPAPWELREKFYVKLDIDPIPEGKDFRVDISKEDAAAVKQQIEERLRGRVQAAAKDVWGRLRLVIEHYAKTMANTDIKFKDATVRNLHDLVEALPALNILEDPALDAFAKDARQSLDWSAKEIRDNPETRKAAAAEAEAVLDRMSGFMNAFSGMQQLKEAA
jgi:hypothetical protein